MCDYLTTATVYCDAAFGHGTAGYGMLARLGERMVARSRPFRFHIPTSGMAEAHALFCVVQACREMMPSMTRIEVNIDCLPVVHAMNGRRRTHGVGGILDAVDTYVVDEEIELDVRWVKGHSEEGARGAANGVAHRLAWLGRHGDKVDYDLPFSTDWRRSLAECDARLSPLNGLTNVPFDQVSSILGVGPEAVARLLKHGHLDYDHTGVTLHSINRVATQVMRMRAEMRQVAHTETGMPVPA